jgi:hypothetical protein
LNNLRRARVGSTTFHLIDHFVGAGEQHGWNREIERIRRLKIDDELERRVSRISTFENVVHRPRPSQSLSFQSRGSLR